MTDPEYTSIDDYVDVEAVNAHRALIESGLTAEEAFAIVRSKARDNARTPMQWEAGPKAGFTTGTPWLRPTNSDIINVAAEETGGRILPYYRELIRLRKTHPVIAGGDVAGFALDHPQVFAFLRTLGDVRLLVLTNFFDSPTEIDIPSEFIDGRVLISNGNRLSVPESPQIELGPYEALGILLDHPQG